MSKVGFRREILGFNREDVIEYIKKTQSETSSREKELVYTLDKLNKRNAELIDEIKKIPELEAKLRISEAAVEKLAQESYDLEQKKAEAERISQDIAKMYIVSKSNAENIKNASKESSDLAFYEIKQTIAAIEKMHNRLNELKVKVEETSKNYSADLDNLTASLNHAKSTIDSVADEVANITNKVNV